MGLRGLILGVGLLDGGLRCPLLTCWAPMVTGQGRIRLMMHPRRVYMRLCSREIVHRKLKLGQIFCSSTRQVKSLR